MTALTYPPTSLSSRAVLSVAGPDADTLLQGVVTQDTAAAAPGAFAALLTPQGKIIVDFFLVRTDGGFLLDVDGEAAADLERRLKMYRLRAKATIERRADLRVLVAPGDAPGDPPTTTDVASYADPRLPALGRRFIAPSGSADAPSGDAAYAAARIAAGVPEFGSSFGADEVFLMDVNYDLLNGVSYRKGCFVGQEVTSRMKRKGAVRKRTMRLLFDEPLAVDKDMDLKQGDATVGILIEPPPLVEGRPNGLAIVRVDRLQPDAIVSVGDATARIDAPRYLRT